MASGGVNPDLVVPSRDTSDRSRSRRKTHHDVPHLEPSNMSALVQMSFTPGTEVLFLGRPHRIAQAVDFDEVLLRDLETKQLVRAKLADLQAAQPMPVIPGPDLLSVTESDWSEAERRREIILPLLGQRRRKR